jgi:uncharacterized protein
MVKKSFMMVEEIINKYYNGQDELKQLLLCHSRRVALRAIEVVEKHPELKADRQFVYEAAMLHDIGIIYTDAPGIGCNGHSPYICHGLHGGELLRAEGLFKHARVAERHTGTGLTKKTIEKQGLPLPLCDFLPETIEEEIVCFADKFYSKSHPEREKTPMQVREMLSRFPDADLEKWDRWVELFC